MASKSSINIPRVLVGGLLAGLTLFITSGVFYGILLKDDLGAWSQSMGGSIHPLAPPQAMPYWALMSLAFGVGGAWLYAVLRPILGAGPKTALVAGLSLWAVSKLTVAIDLFTLGLFPLKILLGQLLCGLVGIVLGVLLGAWLYKD